MKGNVVMSGVNTSVIDNINYVPFLCLRARTVVLHMLTHWNGGDKRNLIGP